MVHLALGSPWDVNTLSSVLWTYDLMRISFFISNAIFAYVKVHMSRNYCWLFFLQLVLCLKMQQFNLLIDLPYLCQHCSHDVFLVFPMLDTSIEGFVWIDWGCLNGFQILLLQDKLSSFCILANLVIDFAWKVVYLWWNTCILTNFGYVFRII